MRSCVRACVCFSILDMSAHSLKKLKTFSHYFFKYIFSNIFRLLDVVQEVTLSLCILFCSALFSSRWLSLMVPIPRNQVVWSICSPSPHSMVFNLLLIPSGKIFLVLIFIMVFSIHLAFPSVLCPYCPWSHGAHSYYKSLFIYSYLIFLFVYLYLNIYIFRIIAILKS